MNKRSWGALRCARVYSAGAHGKVGKGDGVLSEGEARLLVNENADGVNGWWRHCSCCEWQVLTLSDAVFFLPSLPAVQQHPHMVEKYKTFGKLHY